MNDKKYRLKKTINQLVLTEDAILKKYNSNEKRVHAIFLVAPPQKFFLEKDGWQYSLQKHDNSYKKENIL